MKGMTNRVQGIVQNILKGGILLVVTVCISRMYNRNRVENQNIYSTRVLIFVPWEVQILQKEKEIHDLKEENEKDPSCTDLDRK